MTHPLLDRLKVAKTFIDGGLNLGYFTCTAAKTSSAFVYGYEMSEQYSSSR